jgi:putative ABC transport system ATP-binding protein
MQAQSHAAPTVVNSEFFSELPNPGDNLSARVPVWHHSQTAAEEPVKRTWRPGRAGAIRTEAVQRHFRMGEATICAVDGISLDVAAGAFVALLGSSGSGKSSLLNLIAGLDRPTAGAVIVEGRNLADLSGEELSRYRRLRVGMVFQAFNLIPTMTLLENVELPLRFAEVERGKRADLAREALTRVGLEARLTHRPSQISGGEQQRAAIARALVNRPGLLLADEPTGNLDSRTGGEILDLLHESNEQLGMTVVMVTHEQALAERYAERLVFLADGKVVTDQPNVPTRRLPTLIQAGSTSSHPKETA